MAFSAIQERRAGVEKKFRSLIRESHRLVKTLLQTIKSLSRDIRRNQLTLDGERLASLEKDFESALALSIQNYRAFHRRLKRLRATVSDSRTTDTTRFQRLFPFDDPPTTSRLSRSDQLITRSILRHLVRCGDHDIAETLRQEASRDLYVEPDEDSSDRTLEQRIVRLTTFSDLIFDRRCDDALSWLQECKRLDLVCPHRKRSIAELRRSIGEVRFFSLLILGDRAGAVTFLRFYSTPSPPFWKDYDSDTTPLFSPSSIRSLLAYLVPSLSPTPLDTALLRSQTTSLLHATHCLGLSQSSPLLSLFQSSVPSLPALLLHSTHFPTIGSSSSSSSLASSTITTELPIGLSPGLESLCVSTFQNVICCPVSREVTSEHNPPTMLGSCGHVLSLGCVREMASSTIVDEEEEEEEQEEEEREVVRCPYCGVVSNIVNDCIVLVL